MLGTSPSKTNIKDFVMPDFYSQQFKLFSNCLPVKGAERSTICDLERQKVHLIPNGLLEILINDTISTIEGVKLSFNNLYDTIIDEYFDFLVSNDLIFFTDTPDLFPDMDTTWDVPEAISYCIIDLLPQSNFNFSSIAESLVDLDCRYLEVRCFEHVDLYTLGSLMNALNQSTILSVSMIIPKSDAISYENLSKFCDQHARVTGIKVYRGPYNGIRYSQANAIPIEFSEANIPDCRSCGKISDHFFVSTINMYAESLSRNTCLNRKIAIDAEGNIKNCPSMKESYGNISDTTLEEALNKPGFKKYWDIKKDDITKCKDCEFRHVCTDCRAYLDNPDDIYSAPLKCGYNPYTCEWEEWSTNPLKQQAIDHYQMREIL